MHCTGLVININSSSGGDNKGDDASSLGSEMDGSPLSSLSFCRFVVRPHTHIVLVCNLRVLYCVGDTMQGTIQRQSESDRQTPLSLAQTKELEQAIFMFSACY